MAVTAENVGTYQWYVDRGDGKGYVPLSGATSAMYETSPVSAANDGYKYICVVTNEHGSRHRARCLHAAGAGRDGAAKHGRRRAAGRVGRPCWR